jgi:LuxR family maltose regulon positive regulatory protein
MIEALVDRDRLSARLDEHCTVATIRGPAGYGKTTLVAQWSRRRRMAGPVAWVTVRAHSGDAGSFWAGVVDALLDAGVALPPLAQHRSPQALAERMLSIAGPMTLVADNFEHVADDGVDQALLDMVSQSRGARLVVCLRGRRHFPQRLLDDVDSTVIGAQHLLFTAEETAELFTAFGLDPSPGASTLVREATGGWPEPTRTVVRAIRDAGARPTEIADIAESIVTDYVRHRLMPELDRTEHLEFAIVTALPDELTRPITELLADDAAGRSRLEWLEREGLLVSDAPDGEAVCRWPAAARHVLLGEGARRLPDKLAAMRARLARWYLAEDRPAQALRLARAAEDRELVVTVIDQGWRQLLMAHRDDLHDALVATPLEVLATSARALAVRDLWLPESDDRILSAAPLPADDVDLANLGRSDQARDVLDTGLAVHTALRRRGRFDLAHRYATRLLRVAAAARTAHPESTIDLIPSVQLTAGQTFVLAGDVRGCVEPLQRAYEWAADSTLDYVQADAAATLALTHALCGEAQLAQGWLDAYADAPAPSTWLEPTVLGKVAVARILMYLDRLKLDEARDMAATLPVTDRIDADEWWAFRVVAQARMALHADCVEGLDLLDRARARYGTWAANGALAGPLLAEAEADLLMALGRANQAHAVLRGNSDDPLLRVGRARLALLTGNPAGALRLATDRTWQRETTARHRLDMLVIEAVAAHRVGDPSTANRALQAAVDSARSSRLLRPFTTVPAADLEELVHAVPAAAWLLAEPRLSAVKPVFPAALTRIRLTEREQRVLDKLAAGLTLQQTASALVVSYNTVKSQTNALYRKLGATNRDDAIARARHWGLLHRDADLD